MGWGGRGGGGRGDTISAVRAFSKAKTMFFVVVVVVFFFNLKRYLKDIQGAITSSVSKC